MIDDTSGFRLSRRAGQPNTRWRASMTPSSGVVPMQAPPRMCAVVGVSKSSSVTRLWGRPSSFSPARRARSVASGIEARRGALDDNLTTVHHGVPRSCYGVIINANPFDHGHPEAFRPQVIDESLLVARTPLTQYLKQRGPGLWPFKLTLGGSNIQARQASATQMPDQVGRAQRYRPIRPLHVQS